jgi:hypothetical protein
MWSRRQLDPYGIPRPHLAILDDDSHYPCLANQVAVLVPAEGRRHETGLNAVELRAWIAQTGHLDDCRLTKVEPRADRQAERVEALGRNVLAHLSGRNGEPRRLQFFVQFGVDQMHLAKVGLRRVARHSRAVLDGRP